MGKWGREVGRLGEEMEEKELEGEETGTSAKYGSG